MKKPLSEKKILKWDERIPMKEFVYLEEDLAEAVSRILSYRDFENIMINIPIDAFNEIVGSFTNQSRGSSFNQSPQDSVNKHVPRGSRRGKDVRCNSEPTADTSKLCLNCGYREYEHKNQHLLAVDRIEARKFGAPCGSFQPERSGE